MAEEKNEIITSLVKLIENLPPELQFPLLVGVLMVAVVWFFRNKSKDNEEKKEPSHSRTVHIGGNADKAIIQTGDNNRANSDTE